MSHHRILRWKVPVDDRPHPIGRGQACHVAVRPESVRRGLNEVEVWTLEQVPDSFPSCPEVFMRQVQVVGTGQPLPTGWVFHVGSCLESARPLVWHVIEVADHG